MDYRIEEKEGFKSLYSNDLAIQSALNIKHPHRLVMKNLEYLLGCLMFIPQPRNILILGVGGGSLIHFFRHYCPNSEIVGVENDAEFFIQMQSSFDLPKADNLLSYVITDAKQWIKTNTAQFDLIIVDIFNEHSMPSWVQQADFIRNIYKHLTEQGCTAWNMLFSSDSDFNHFYSKFRLISEQKSLCLQVDEYENTMVFGFKQALVHSDIESLMQFAVKSEEQYELPFNQILGQIFNINPVDSGFI